jgi:hypothetical protein
MQSFKMVTLLTILAKSQHKLKPAGPEPIIATFPLEEEEEKELLLPLSLS